MKSKLLASSRTIDGIKRVIGQFYFSSDVILVERLDGENLWSILTNGGIMENTRVTIKDNMYRFEMVLKGDK